MMDMVEEEIETQQADVTKYGDELISKNACNIWSRQSTMEPDELWSRQTTPWSRQTTPEATEPGTQDAKKEIPRRRASSPSLHVMQDMADEEVREGIVTQVTIEPKRNIEKACLPRRRASSPSLHMMMDMIEEA